MARAATSKKVVTENAEFQKQELEQQMEESRESISNTVADLKDAVVDEYQSIKQGISDTLDWREQFRNHPVAWMVGALSVGYVLGNSLGTAYKGAKGEGELLAYLGALGDKFTDELSRRGMSILTPALTGTILVPILNSQLQKAFGVDLTDLPEQLFAEVDTSKTKKLKAKSKKKSRKNPKNNGKSKR